MTENPTHHFFYKKNQWCQLSQSILVKNDTSGYQSSLETYIFLLEVNCRQFPTFWACTQVRPQVCLKGWQMTWCIIFLLEKNWERWQQFFSSKKMIHQVGVKRWLKTWHIIFVLEQNGANCWRFTSSKKCLCLRRVGNLMYHLFNRNKLRQLTVILF